MRTEIKLKSLNKEVYGGRLQLIIAMCLNEAGNFPWIVEAFEEWKPDLVAGLVVDFSDYISSPDSISSFEKLLKRVEIRLNELPDTLCKETLTQLENGLFNSTFGGSVPKSDLLDTLNDVKDLLKRARV